MAGVWLPKGPRNRPKRIAAPKRKRAALPVPLEHTSQVSIAKELRWRVPPGVAWTAVDHAKKQSLRQGAMQKARGIKPGQADFRFIVPPHGLAVEMELKREKGGSQSDSQEWWQGEVEAAGGKYFLVRSMAEVEAALLSVGVRLLGTAG